MRSAHGERLMGRRACRGSPQALDGVRTQPPPAGEISQVNLIARQNFREKCDGCRSREGIRDPSVAILNVIALRKMGSRFDARRRPPNGSGPARDLDHPLERRARIHDQFLSIGLGHAVAPSGGLRNDVAGQNPVQVGRFALP